MVQSIVTTGLAIGCIYALIGITYNVMYSASRVFSFTAGTLGMLGGVLGALFIGRMGKPAATGIPMRPMNNAPSTPPSMPSVPAVKLNTREAEYITL